jgi:hypothetical protein
MSHSETTAMRSAAAALLAALTGEQRSAATYPVDGPDRTRWAYQPRPRPGVSLLGLDGAARKAAHRLLATAVSRVAFAQAVTIMALEEVLDQDEGGGRFRHSDDYWVALFGAPTDDVWSWRFEGHHVSVTATVAGSAVSVAPLFLGANPARINDRDHLVLGPLWREEDLARTLLAELPAPLRSRAVVDDRAPSDILTGTQADVAGFDEPCGVRGAQLTGPARDLLDRLLQVYLDRLSPALARREYEAIQLDEVCFAWAGPPDAGQGHYYRLLAPALLIEYDNTQRSANHAHTVLRRPGEDFGAGLLADHLTAERPAA